MSEVFSEDRLLSEVSLFESRRYRILKRQVRTRRGEIRDFEVVEKSDSVAMVAIDGDRNVILVREFFAGIQARTLCLPKGSIDSDESPIDAAVRELKEETGFTGDFRQVALLAVSPGYLTQRTWLYLVENLNKERLPCDEHEDIEVCVIPLKDTLRMVALGEITEARTVAGLAFAAGCFAVGEL